eukprot:TRINITY_DN30303_c0_g1_i1.p1 TRINITY_DN30303_c0_g1~~TRINITY_DN30303_c0_g1_i1.p1  ORF type:complete len:293 (-),score=44.45 TRINITY_DN30303_c0_g1_i1:251-1093(-)
MAPEDGSTGADGAAGGGKDGPSSSTGTDDNQTAPQSSGRNGMGSQSMYGGGMGGYGGGYGGYGGGMYGGMGGMYGGYGMGGMYGGYGPYGMGGGTFGNMQMKVFQMTQMLEMNTMMLDQLQEHVSMTYNRLRDVVVWAFALKDTCVPKSLPPGESPAPEKPPSFETEQDKLEEIQKIKRRLRVLALLAGLFILLVIRDNRRQRKEILCDSVWLSVAKHLMPKQPATETTGSAAAAAAGLGDAMRGAGVGRMGGYGGMGGMMGGYGSSMMGGYGSRYGGMY